jgi:hypothetical protein
MRTGIDALRSVMDYAYEILGEPWRIREIGEQGTFKRPAVRIGATTSAQHTGNREIIETVQGFALHAFPEPGATAMASRIVAGAVEDELLKGVRAGAGTLGRAQRIPLWDYAAVGEAEAPTAEARRHTDYIRVVDLDSELVQSPTDELLFTVSLNMRLRWLQEGDVVEDGPNLTSVVLDLDLS